MSDNLGGKYVIKKKDPLRAFYPVIGLVLMGIGGAVGFFARTPAYSFIKANVLQNTSGLPSDEQMEWIVAFSIFLIITLVFAAVFALFAPKPSKLVNESQLKAEKQDRDRERLRAKRRKSEMRKKMKAANKGLDDI